jgi:hypothetical protein
VPTLLGFGEFPHLSIEIPHLPFEILLTPVQLGEYRF